MMDSILIYYDSFSQCSILSQFLAHLIAPWTARWASTMWESAPLARPPVAAMLGIMADSGISFGRPLDPKVGGACELGRIIQFPSPQRNYLPGSFHS